MDGADAAAPTGNNVTTWKIDDSGKPAPQRARDPSAVPLKWAHDARNGEPRYIHDPEIISRKCSCTCPACNLTLTAVMPGQPRRIRPTAHFRHPAGSQKDECSLVAARLAATRHLLELGFMVLPRRRMSRTAKGFSGEGYEVWVEEPAERVAVVGARLRDHATAILTLDDGRQLLVDLTGLREHSSSNGGGQAVVTMSLSDPEIASLGPDEIRARLRILPDISWCSHWKDGSLADRGDAAGASAARAALDAWDDADEKDFRSHLPPDVDEATAQRLRRETLLHREVKAILEQAATIATPGLEIHLTRNPPEEFAGEWADNTVRKTWLTAPRELEIDEVRLERRLGRIVPDVIANLGGRQIYTQGGTLTEVDDVFDEDAEDRFSLAWPLTLLIEVTVTHHIDDEKLRRIRELDLPTLEIDLSTLGGRVTLEGLRELVVKQTVGKRWVHHPNLRAKRRQLEEEIDEHPFTIELRQRLADLRRPRLLATPATQWASQYLDAATAFHDANTQIRKGWRQHTGSGPKPPLLGTDSELWSRLMEAAEALAAHGMPGAADAAMLSDTGLVPRILSIQLNRGVGYAVDTGFQVLNAIMQSGTENKRWDTLYSIAVKAYGLEAHFTPKQADKYGAWRQTIIDKVAADDDAYFRPATYDAVLSTLFPDMARGIATGYGRITREL